MEMPGWGTAFGAVFNKLTQFIKGPIESAKNEKERLLNERSILMSKDFSASGSRRVSAIDARLQVLDTIIASKSSD